MPVYEYHCNSCHRNFEYQQRMSDPEKDVCEACGGALERMISRTAFALKGGGWYKDLYASSKPEPAKFEGGKSVGSDSSTSTPSTTSSDSGSSDSSGSSSGSASSSSGSSSGSSSTSGSSSGST